MTITKKLGLITAFSSAVLLNTGCTSHEEAFVAGPMYSYDHPYYYDRPYYYYHGRYYYGGRYSNGYYYYKGDRYYGGHYYHRGYRYHKGRRYIAVSGRYGYYRSRKDYRRSHSSRSSIEVRGDTEIRAERREHIRGDIERRNNLHIKQDIKLDRGLSIGL
ncbi:MAG: hypothetical protein ABXS91_05300 [Sulfurimonas sp.]